MTLKNSVGIALTLAGTAVGVAGFLLHGATWALGGCLLFFIGLLLYRSPALSMDPDCVDSDPADPGDLEYLAYLEYLGDLSDSGDSDGGDS